jgi:hypothetical protein
LGGAAEFDGTLVSILQNRPADCEVLVVHTEAYDDPYELHGEVRFLETKTDSILELLNIAVHAAAGEILHIVNCGLEASEGWTKAAVAHFDDPEVAAVSPLIVGPDRESIVAAGIRWSAGGARHVVRDRRIAVPGSGRLRARVLGPTLAAAFYRRDVLAAVGGFDTDLGAELADVGAGVAIQALGRLRVCEPASQLVQVYLPRGARDGGFVSGRGAERLFWRWASMHGWAVALGLHPFSVVADCIRRGATICLATSLLGRVASSLEVGALQRYQQTLSHAANRLAEAAELRRQGGNSAGRAKRKKSHEPLQLPRRRAA